MPRHFDRAVVLAAFSCLSFATTSPILAQAPRRPVTVGLGGGGTVPLGDYAKDVKTAWNAIGLLQYEPANSMWGVRGEVQYHRSGYTDSFISDVGATADDKLSNGVLYAGASALLLGTKRERGFAPYLIGGLGWYRQTATLKGATATSLSQSEDGFGFSGGAGIRFGRSSGVFVEARFHQFSFTTDGGTGVGKVKSTNQLIPVTVGILF